MNAKKKMLSFFVTVMVLSLATISAFATVIDGDYSTTVPSDAVSYDAGTCHSGFTTSRYLSKGSGWNDTIHVSNTYVLWDDWWELHNCELVQVKNGNVSVSAQVEARTGLYKADQYGIVENPGTNRSSYTPFVGEIVLYANAADYSQLNLRITKPNYQNYPAGTDSIDNMKVWGYFWK